MKKSLPIATLVVIFVLLITMASRTADRTTSSGPIRLGAVIPLTGPVAGLGDALRKGYEWKVEELNKQGKNVTITIEDSKSDAKDAVTAWNKLVGVNSIPIVFSTMSSVGMALKPLAEQTSTLLWADAAHPNLTRGSKFTLRHSNISDKDAQVIGDKVIELKRTKTGILFQNDDWGTAASKALSELLAHNEIIAVSDGVDNRSGDLRSSISRLMAAKVDCIVTIVAGPASGIIIKQARELGFKGDIISSVGIVLTPDAQQLAGTYLKGTYYQSYVDSSEFAADYRARFSSEPQSFTHVAYTDIEILMNAIDQTGTVDPLQIARYVKGLRTFKGKYETVDITADGDIIVPTVIKQF